MQREIANKVVIITGASSGIGRQTALALGREKARLVLVARRSSLLDEIRLELEKTGTSVICLTLDLTRREDVQRMIQETRDAFGRIDVLINNAGFGFFGTVENTPLSVVDEIFELNFNAPLIACQLVIPIMRAQRSGQIINIASVAGKRGMPLSGIYCATKFALDGLTQSLRLELKSEGIDVSIIHPAGTKTEFQEQIRMGDVHGRFKPIGHVQSAEAVAAAIVQCIRRPKIEVYPNSASRIVAWCNAIAPSLLDRIMASFFHERFRAKNSA